MAVAKEVVRLNGGGVWVGQKGGVRAGDLIFALWFGILGLGP